MSGLLKIATYAFKKASLRKTAGVGWDIHGYPFTPHELASLDKTLEEEDDEKWWDASDKMFESRIKTPHDKDINYKAMHWVDWNYNNGGLDKYTTDACYSDKPTIRNLTKKDLVGFKAGIQSMEEKHKSKDPNDYKSFAGHYLDMYKKIDYLSQHPDVKTIRVEYE